MALSGFDKDYYLSVKLAALQATETEWVSKDADFLETVLLNVYGLTPEDHYSQYGHTEGLAPNAYFNEAEYKLAKATQLFDAGYYMSIEDAQAAFVAAWTGDAYNHYLAYGSKEGVNPSNAFDESSYLASKLAALKAATATATEWAAKTTADVQAGFTDAGLSVLGHYIAYGKDEGIAVTPVPTDEQVDVDVPAGVVGETFTLTTGVDQIDGSADDDTINGHLTEDPETATLNVFDVIDGGEGVDTLKVLMSEDADYVTFATVTNVENIEFNLVGDANTTDSDIDMSLVSGVTNLTFNVGPDANTTSELDFFSANLETLTFSGVDADQDNDSSYFGLYINTNDSTQIGIETIEMSDLYDDPYLEIDNLTNIPVLNLTNLGRTDDASISLEVLDSVATGTDDTLTIVADNAGAMTYDYWESVDIYIENATGDEDLYENVDITVSGDNGIYLGDSEGLETVTLSGTGDLQLWFSDSEAVSTFDGSLHSGDLSSTIDSVQDVTATLGDGDHWIRWSGSNGAGTVDATLTINTGAGSTWLSDRGVADEGHIVADLGAGNDYFDANYAHDYDVTLGDGDDILELNGTGDIGTADSVAGGAGTDTIIGTAAEFGDANMLSALSGFEQLIAEGAGTYDMSTLAGITNVISGGYNEIGFGPTAWWDPDVTIDTRHETGNADVVFDNVEAGTTLTVNRDNSQTVTYALATDTTDDAVTVVLGNMDDDTNDDVVLGTAATDGLDLSGIETITINSVSHELDPDDTADAVDTNTIQELVADAAATIFITGDADTVINGIENTLDGIGGTVGLTKIDASALTADLTFGEQSDSTTSIQYIGAEGVDTYLGTDNGDTINAGTGADDITLGAAGAADTIIINDGGSTFAAMDVYDTFETGEDTIDLGAYGFSGTAASALFSMGAIATLPADGDDDIADFFNSAGVDRAVAWGTNGGNTYVYVDANGDGDLSIETDTVIELAGITSIQLADFGF